MDLAIHTGEFRYNVLKDEVGIETIIRDQNRETMMAMEHYHSMIGYVELATMPLSKELIPSEAFGLIKSMSKDRLCR